MFASTPSNRCHICKKIIFSTLLEEAAKLGISTIADGSNLDDLGDYRSGLKALEELQVKSPLREAGFSKGDIRALSKELALPTWNKQSNACLATRFPYGSEITIDKLCFSRQGGRDACRHGFYSVSSSRS